MCVGDILQAAARRQPEKAAVIFNNRTTTYRELDYASRALAHWLLAQGLKPGDRVAVHWGNSSECLTLLLACLHAGVIALPVNTRLKAAEVAYILGHAQPAMCFTQPALAPIAAAARVLCQGLPEWRTQLPEISGDEASLPRIAAGNPCVLMYTSGTTSRPKGVTHTHATVAATIQGVLSSGMSESDSVLNMMPLMHVSGFTCMSLSTLAVGATMVLMAGFDPAAILDAIERHRCTGGMGLPAMMQFLCAEQERRPRNVSALRWWGAGGDSVAVALQERFSRLFGIPLTEGYAMTECTPIAMNRHDANRTGSVGRPSAGVETRVLDFSGNPAPEGEVGELAVKSAANFTGYWNDPAATANTLVDGWLLTGDLLRRDADGFLWFAGRRKELIIRGGSNISPQEVEEALYRHPAVFEAGVVGVPDEVYGQQVAAGIVLRPGCPATADEIREHARTVLADYKVPERIVFLEVLPKGLTGKVQRRELVDLLAGASLHARPATEPAR